MGMDAVGIGTLLSGLQPPQSDVAKLQERQNQLLQAAQSGQDGRQRPGGVIAELKAVTTDLQQAQYEETHRKLYQERLAREAALAPDARRQERALAEQESFLLTASLSKLVQANRQNAKPDSSEPRQAMETLTREVRQAVSLGVEAAAVARKRRQKTEQANRENREEAALQAAKQGAKAKKRQRAGRVDVTV